MYLFSLVQHFQHSSETNTWLDMTGLFLRSSKMLKTMTQNMGITQSRQAMCRMSQIALEHLRGSNDFFSAVRTKLLGTPKAGWFPFIFMNQEKVLYMIFRSDGFKGKLAYFCVKSLPSSSVLPTFLMKLTTRYDKDLFLPYATTGWCSSDPSSVL